MTKGSSPLARGALADQAAHRRVSRLIPARAGSTPRRRRPRPRRPAHPRSRGEHRQYECPLCGTGGSSPLARGAPVPAGGRRAAVRLIPARAGSTRAARATRPRAPAHPRSRGEHSGPDRGGGRGCRLIPARAGSTCCRGGRGGAGPAHPRSRGEHVHGPRVVITGFGSSPLARGAPRRAGEGPGAARLIPARAGSTRRTRSGARTPPAHPRSRGEHTLTNLSRSFSTGSSPLARGALTAESASTTPAGLIPARAGSTPRVWTWGRAPRAHPRSRGEHSDQSTAVMSPRGSSPLARGAPVELVAHPQADRLIPARAGSTPCGCGSRPPKPAHPRSRGEHVDTYGHLARSDGSSPLARGARPAHAVPRGRPGLIPARAGSTTRSGSARSGTSAHPRSRGEHDVGAAVRQAVTGSSPLARGALLLHDPSVLQHGLIPARAGSTARGSAPATRAAGSSPLARGARTGSRARSGPGGLIPARAGSTRSLLRARSWARAHPRSRGEHDETALSTAPYSGSSPLARGAPHRGAARSRPRGLIPARVGSTMARYLLDLADAAHPRSRGEHAIGGGATHRSRGSSPLARGAPRRRSAPPATTPAHPRSRGEHQPPAPGRPVGGGSSPLARGAPGHQRPQPHPRRLIPARAGSTARRGRRACLRRAHPRSRGEHDATSWRLRRRPGSSPLARGAPRRRGVVGHPVRLIPARAGSTAP